MIRRWCSNFIKKNINKIRDVGIKLIIVAIVVYIATIMISAFRGNNSDLNTEVYKPRETIIKGTEVSEKQYKFDSNVVEKFLNHCNNGEVEEAYSLLSKACKENKYSTINVFKEFYYNFIFENKKDYNIQAWVSTNKYTVYRIRYITDMLSTGKYEENEVYEDYITLIKNTDKEEVSIGSFVFYEELNVETRTNEIEANVLNRYTYMDYEEYTIQIKNCTDKVMLIDTLETNQTIKLIGNSGGSYTAYMNKLNREKLKINPNSRIIITIRFKKEVASDNKADYINFYRVIKDYNTYIQNTEEYTDTVNIKINV